VGQLWVYKKGIRFQAQGISRKDECPKLASKT